MAQAVRSNKKAMKIAYSILKTPKEQQQNNDYKPSKKQLRAWWIDSINSQ